MIDWDSLRSRDFKRRPDDPEQFERYQAEALAHRHVPLEAIEGLVCRGVEERRKLEAMMESVGRSLIVQVRPDCYF
jgi:hypothetical protein